MTIHAGHPFPTEPDPIRRLRARLGGAVTLWTAGAGSTRTGLTVTSVMVAGGEPARVLALIDPDSDLADRVEDTGRAVVHLLTWSHRDLADAFAGVAPAPGGPFRLGEWADTDAGPRLVTAPTWAEVSVESTVQVGWSSLLTCLVDDVVVGEETDDESATGATRPLLHRRGRYR